MRIVIITNILTPYRKYLYDTLECVAKQQKTSIHILVMSNTEEGRKWKYQDFATESTEILQKKVIFGKTDSLYWSPNISKRLNEINPDVIILAGGYVFIPIWQALVWAKRNKCNTYFWSESHLDEKHKLNAMKVVIREFARKLFYRNVDGYWYPGRKAKDLINKYSKTGKTYIQVPNLVDAEDIVKRKDSIRLCNEELRCKYGLDCDKYVFFSPARLDPEKGFLEFLDEIKSSSMKERFQIAIAGDGSLRELILEKAKAYDVDVILLGYRDIDEMIELYVASDCVLLPSISDPNPLVCVEALWCGKPLLVSEHVGNYPEVIDVDVNGYVFSYKQRRDALAKLERVVCNGEKWNRNAAERSKMIARDKFEGAETCVRVLRELTQNKSCAREDGDR